MVNGIHFLIGLVFILWSVSGATELEILKDLASKNSYGIIYFDEKSFE